MYQLNLNVGSKVRNIREHSSFKGMIGYVECEINEGKGDKWLVLYQDGRRGTYFKHLAHHSLQFVDEYKSVKQTIKEQPKSERIMIKRERRNIITGYTQSDMIKAYGNTQGVINFNTRALGKTTGQALCIIGNAMIEHNEVIDFSDLDHSIIEHKTPKGRATMHLRDNIMFLIKKLDLKGFVCTQTTLTFNPIVTEETYVERV
ncbi:hypothetical protein Pm5460_12 [Proteus phage vB_PmiP_Pm5460]|uniref:Uncharacterized protein n=1 Tax=Proteus phage vB_PmiP_Pm5460 TaxID=1636249 RepID=A0A0G2SSE0_9CAUD|nr:hypothetical protein AVT60_gp12 [Proteus phage vB_PmiP_Pm5460]AKA61821.1 hypothetical protein Pm5460_12 [Proteus phage vB_PmiP_Pm5460]